jgi:hypothetical protein
MQSLFQIIEAIWGNIFVMPGYSAHILKTRIIMYNPFYQQQKHPTFVMYIHFRVHTSV